jgi:hypothetical protein
LQFLQFLVLKEKVLHHHFLHLLILQYQLFHKVHKLLI